VDKYCDSGFALERQVAVWRSNGCQLPPIQQHNIALSWRHMHYFSKRSDQWCHSYLLRINFCFRSRANLVEQQIQIYVVIGGHLSDAEEIAHAGSAFFRWVPGSWCPLASYFERLSFVSTPLYSPTLFRNNVMFLSDRRTDSNWNCWMGCEVHFVTDNVCSRTEL